MVVSAFFSQAQTGDSNPAVSTSSDPDIETGTWFHLELEKERYPGVTLTHHHAECRQVKEDMDTSRMSFRLRRYVMNNSDAMYII